MKKMRWYLSRIKRTVLWHYYQYKIDRRVKLKIAGNKKVRVLFVCHRPAVWGALQTVYEAFEKDDLFEALIVTVPQRDMQDPGKYCDEGADVFFAKYSPISGFLPEENCMLDILTLQPDIVFYQQPYDLARDENCRATRMWKHAKIAHVNYFSVFPELLNDEVLRTCYPMVFFRCLTYFFSQNPGEDRYVRNMLKENKINNVRTIVTGYPKNDNLSEYENAESNVWRYPAREKRFRILWTPRWTTNENSCNFFNYKDAWFTYCQGDNTVDFVFRPHPQSWMEWKTTGEFTEQEQIGFQDAYSKMDNMTIDENGEYLATLYSSDCLVSDTSSLILQYFLTGKPIIFCDHVGSCFTINRDSNVAKGIYFAENWGEVESCLEMLRHGDDPLREKRMEIIKYEFKLESDVTAGEKIKQIIKKDILSI